MGFVIPLAVLWALSQLQAEPLENPLPAPALNITNPFAELPVYCFSNSAPLLEKGTELPAAQVVSAIPLSAILSAFGVIDYTVCDASSGIMLDDGTGGHELPGYWRFYNA